MHPTKSLFSALFLAFLAIGCKTTLSATQATDGPACPKPAEVHYQPPKNPADAPTIIPKGTTVGVGLFDFVNIEVKPEDFSKLDSHDCKPDGTCRAVMTKPVKVNVNVPVDLFAKVAITYEQAKGDKEGVCLRKVSVGTKIGLPVCLGKILDFSINMGLGMSKSEDTTTQKITYDAKPYCNANFSCNLPFLSASAKLDQHGLTFGSAVSTNTVIPNALVKVSPPPTKSYTIAFPKLPDPVAKLKEYFTSHKSSGSALNLSSSPSVDIYWEDIAYDCNI